jgi:hypothetical protein
MASFGNEVSSRVEIEYGNGDIFFKTEPSKVINGIQISYTGFPTITINEIDNWVFKKGTNIFIGYFNSAGEGYMEKNIATYYGDLDIEKIIICDNKSMPYKVKVTKISGKAKLDKSNWSTDENKVQYLGTNKNIRKPEGGLERGR